MKIRSGILLLSLASLLLITAVFSASSCTSAYSDLSRDNTFKEPPAGTESEPAETKAKPAPVFTVIIDPGHGFGDPGSHPEFIYCDEADITLRAALLLKDKLSKAGIQTVLTHNGEKFPAVRELIASAQKYKVEYNEEKMVDNDVFSAYERVIYSNIIAKELGSCFFVSLHTNSVADSPSTCGLSVDYYKYSPLAAALEGFCNDLSGRIGTELGKKTVIFADEAKEAYIVNKYCDSPSVLIEMGYASNRQDGSDLMNDIWLEQLCGILSECIAHNKASLHLNKK